MSTITVAGWYGCASATSIAHNGSPHWRESTWEQNAAGAWQVVSFRRKRVVAWDLTDPCQIKVELGEWEGGDI